MPQVIVIAGPTASGKTALGVELALKFNGEVISADSMQLYKYMDIGTAKPDASEMKGVVHHMMDVVSPFEDYSVSRYVEDASKCADDIISRGKVPIIVGGTGLYIESLLSGRDFADNSSDGIRDELYRQYDSLGGEKMLDILRQFDPESADKLSANDKKRIVRAIEVYKATGITKTQHDLQSREIPPRYTSSRILLSFKNRADLYERINRRVDIMMEKGLYAEVKKLIEMGLKPGCTAVQAIGYKELAQVIISGGSVESAVEKIKQESRRYAKRQLSWFRRDSSAKWLLWDKTLDYDYGLHILTDYLIEEGYNISVKE